MIRDFNSAGFSQDFSSQRISDQERGLGGFQPSQIPALARK